MISESHEAGPTDCQLSHPRHLVYQPTVLHQDIQSKTCSSSVELAEELFRIAATWVPSDQPEVPACTPVLLKMTLK